MPWYKVVDTGTERGKGIAAARRFKDGDAVSVYGALVKATVLGISEDTSTRQAVQELRRTQQAHAACTHAPVLGMRVTCAVR